MSYLLIDTAGKMASVTICYQNKTSSTILPNERRHSDTLLVELEKLLQKEKVKLSDFSVIAAVTGPGSFTGIRVGLSTIKAFAEAFPNIKLIGLSVFDIVKTHVKNGFIIIKSTKTHVYYANIKKSAIVDVGVVRNDEIKKLVENRKIFVLQDDDIELDLPSSVISNYHELAQRQVQDMIEAQLFIKNEELVPMYIQLSQAELTVGEK